MRYDMEFVPSPARQTPIIEIFNGQLQILLFLQLNEPMRDDFTHGSHNRGANGLGQDITQKRQTPKAGALDLVCFGSRPGRKLQGLAVKGRR